MKRLFVVTMCLAVSMGAWAQRGAKKEAAEPEGYRFTDVKTVGVTPVKNQSSSGTCWAFSGVAFLESEVLRNGGPEVDLSEMFIVRHTYFDKAVKYVRMHGALNFGQGGATHDVMNVVREYGIVPEEVYTGLNYGTDLHRHGELDAVLTAYVNAVVKNPNRTLTTAWKEGINGILDAYLGPLPEKFTYKGKEYTPKSYAESLGLDMDDYVSFTSYTHHPFYSQFAIEVPDNWAYGLSYNVPLEELEALFEQTVEQGYSIYWATDVSERGFSRQLAMAVVPEADVQSMDDTEAARWGKLTEAEKEAELYKFDKPGKEKAVTQQMRQEAYDNYQTTDDHGMQIVGTAVDQAGNKYYKVKNSWGETGPYAGYYYFSYPFVYYKTMNMVVNKNAVPVALREKCGIR